MPKLTKRTVESVRPNGREQFVWDSELRGFGLRVLRSGRRSYFIQYRVKGRTRRMALGPHGVLTPENARRRAIRELAAVRDGADPSAARQQAYSAATMAELAERYLEEHAIPKNKPSSVETVRTYLRLYIIPAFGPMKIEDVTRVDVGRLHHELRRVPYVANRTLAVLSKMFNLAERWGLRPDGSNPCRHIDRYPERRRERFLSSAELTRLGEVLTELEDSEPWPALAAIRLLILTGARRGEILGLRWEYVDFERGFLRLPDSKTGPKVILLNSPSRALLDRLRASRDDADSPWVIPGLRPNQALVGLTRAWYRVRKRAGLEDVRLHDLRHSFASVAAGAGVPLIVIGRLLGHRHPVTTARYAHLADDPLREASEKIGARVAAAMWDSPKGRVLQLRNC